MATAPESSVDREYAAMTEELEAERITAELLGHENMPVPSSDGEMEFDTVRSDLKESLKENELLKANMIILMKEMLKE